MGKSLKGLTAMRMSPMFVWKEGSQKWLVRDNCKSQRKFLSILAKSTHVNDFVQVALSQFRHKNRFWYFWQSCEVICFPDIWQLRLWQRKKSHKNFKKCPPFVKKKKCQVHLDFSQTEKYIPHSHWDQERTDLFLWNVNWGSGKRESLVNFLFIATVHVIIPE